jgi:hypothetical protein
MPPSVSLITVPLEVTRLVHGEPATQLASAKFRQALAAISRRHGLQRTKGRTSSRVQSLRHARSPGPNYGLILSPTCRASGGSSIGGFPHGIHHHSRLSSCGRHGLFRCGHSRRIWHRPVDRFGSLRPVGRGPRCQLWWRAEDAVHLDSLIDGAYIVPGLGDAGGRQFGAV